MQRERHKKEVDLWVKIILISRNSVEVGGKKATRRWNQD